MASCIPSLRPFTKYIREQYTTRNRRRPDPLTLHKERHLNSADAAILPSSQSRTRMQPRSSGSVSSSAVRLPTQKAFRQNSLQPIQSRADGGEHQDKDTNEKGKGIDWKGFDMAAAREDRNVAENPKEVETGGLDPGLGAGSAIWDAAIKEPAKKEPPNEKDLKEEQDVCDEKKTAKEG
ncbi:MAG: hypothetical protein Q9174_002435 [Haloplaca sp. 1 TL-2023]